MTGVQTYFTSRKCTPEYHRFWYSSYNQTKLIVAVHQASKAPQSASGRKWSSQEAVDLVAYAEECAFTRLIDNFQTYVVELISTVFLARPEMVPSSKIDTKLLFQINDLAELRSLVVENAATSYAYMNIVDLDDELRKKYSFPLFSNELQKGRVRRLVEIRNAIVHNRSLVGRVFLNRVGAKVDKIGEKVRIPFSSRTDKYLTSLAEQIDRNAVSKFGLKRLIDA